MRCLILSLASYFCLAQADFRLVHYNFTNNPAMNNFSFEAIENPMSNIRFSYELNVWNKVDIPTQIGEKNSLSDLFDLNAIVGSVTGDFDSF
jgi:hypothetical protein